MRGVVVTDRKNRNLRCAHCRKVGKPGDVMMVHMAHNEFGAISKLCWHKVCMVDIVVQAPKTEDQVQQAFEAIQRRIAAGETIF